MGHKYSTQQLRQVFMQYASGGSGCIMDSYIPTMDFKDRFFPGYHWARTAPLPSATASQFSQPSSRSGIESRSESMHVDHIMAGKRHEDVQQDKLLQEDKRVRDIENKYKGGRDALGVIHEDRFEVASQSSLPSRAIDDIVGRDVEPRRGKNAPGGSRP